PANESPPSTHEESTACSSPITRTLPAGYWLTTPHGSEPVIDRGPRNRRCVRAPPEATTEDRTSMAWLSVSESTAEARTRPTRRWDASITAVRNRDRHRRTPARAPIVGSESAAEAAALDQ